MQEVKIEEYSRNNRIGLKAELAGIVAALTFYSTCTWGVYYKCNQELKMMSPKARADISQEYVESWKRADIIMKYNPYGVGLYLSAKKYAQENPLRKNGKPI